MPLTDVIVAAFDSNREEFDFSGMEVCADQLNGTRTPVTGNTVNGYNALKLGTQTLTVTWLDLTTTFTEEVVEVSSAAVSSDKDISVKWNVGLRRDTVQRLPFRRRREFLSVPADCCRNGIRRRVSCERKNLLV